MALTARTEVSEAEYRRLALLEGNGLLELHDGRLREKPPMSRAHGDVTMDLMIALAGQLDRGEYRVRAQHARLPRTARNYYIPDVAVVPAGPTMAARNDPSALDAYADPVPLVVEVWSPSTGDYDIEQKLPAYKARGDLEVWRIHPYQRRLTAWRRQPDGSYAETVYLGGAVPVASLPGVEIDLDALFGA